MPSHGHQSSAPPQRIRIGLLLNDWKVPAWVAECIASISCDSANTIILCVVNQEVSHPPSFFKRLAGATPHILYSLYLRIDRYLNRGADDPFSMIDIRPLLQNVDALHVKPVRKRFSHYFTKEDIESIKDKQVDILIRFGFSILRGEILEVAPYGIWSYHHGDNRFFRGSPPGFWEMYHDEPVIGITLQRLTKNLDAGHTLCRSFSPVHLTSLYRTRTSAYWTGAHMVSRLLKQVRLRGWESALSSPHPAKISLSTLIYKTPTNREMLNFFRKYPARSVGNIASNAFRYPKWSIAWRDAKRNVIAESDTFDFRDFHAINPPRGKFYADPFVWSDKGRTYIVFEEWSSISGRGKISGICRREDGTWTRPFTVLDRGYHMSYPFLIRWRGETYLIPETAVNKQVEIYRAVEFPHHWELAAIRLKGHRAVDTTVHFHNGKLWIFTNIGTRSSVCHNDLHLFFADDLLGEWLPHPSSPVVSDPRTARPAGRIFEFQGTLIRPSQDCSVRYGYALNFNEITCLSESAYSENLRKKVTPDWMPGNLGSHTWNNGAGIDTIDCYSMQFKPLTYILRRGTEKFGLSPKPHR